MYDFHQMVARSVATDKSGRFDPRAYSVVLLALAPYAIKADLETSSSRKLPEAARVYWDVHVEGLQKAFENLTGRSAASFDDLRIPSDPRVDSHFFDRALPQLYDGWDCGCSPNKTLTLKSKAERKEFEPIRCAVAAFASEPNVGDILRCMFEHQTELGLGSDATLAPKTAKRTSFRNMFRDGAICCTQAAIPHFGCVLSLTTMAGISSAGAGMAHSPEAMLAFGAVPSLVSYGLWWRFLGGRRAPRPLKLGMIGSTVFGLALMAGIHLTRHAHGSHQHHPGGTSVTEPHHHMGDGASQPLSESERQWLARLSTTQRAQIEANASAKGISQAEYVHGVCIPERPPDITSVPTKPLPTLPK